MDSTLIVFAVGTVASFLPLYWLAIRFSAWWNRPVSASIAARAEPSGRREFLDLLRREAATRAVTVLREALAEARLAADHGGGHRESALSPEMRRSLAETGRLIDSLFTPEIGQKFKRSADALVLASSSTVGAAGGACVSVITAFERALGGDAERVPATRHGARGWRSFLPRRRALVGMSGARAAA